MEKITLDIGENEKVDFYVLEQTRLGGTDYILVTDQEEGDGDALILKDTSKEADAEAVYEVVSEDGELSAVAAVFEELLDDVSFISEE